jgi:hypothetical protein
MIALLGLISRHDKSPTSRSSEAVRSIRISASSRRRDLEQSHNMRTNGRPIAIMRRSCSDSPLAASQMDGMEYSETTPICCNRLHVLLLRILHPSQPVRSLWAMSGLHVPAGANTRRRSYLRWSMAGAQATGGNGKRARSMSDPMSGLMSGSTLYDTVLLLSIVAAIVAGVWLLWRM